LNAAPAAAAARSDQGGVTGPVFYTLAAVAFISGVNLRLFDALLPSVAEHFAVAPTAAAAAVTAFTLAYGLFQVVHGPLGDRLGKLRVVAAATVAVSLASLGCALAPSLSVLTVLRFVAGVAAAAVFPLTIAWIGDSTDYKDRQATIARFVGFLLFGQVLGPALSGLLAQTMGWREVFYILAAVYLLAGGLLSYRVRRQSAPSAPRRSVLRDYARVLRDRWVLTILAVSFLEGGLFFGVMAYAGAYLKTRFALSYFAVGAIVACYGLGAVAYTLLVRRLMARLNEKGFVTASALVLLAGFAALALLPVWQATAPLFAVIGFGFYLLHNTLQTKATEMVPEARGIGVAVFAFSLFLGQSAGVAGFGRLIDAVGYRWAFAAAAVLLALLGLFFASRLSAQERAGGRRGDEAP